MGTDVQGYIEINTCNESGEDLWFNVIDIGIVVERNYEMFGKLFGVRAVSNAEVLAASRGLPEGTPNRKELGTNEERIVNQSWATWKEIEAFIPNINIDSELWGWPFIFDNMSSLSQRYGLENVRLVVAFDNYG